MTSIIFFIIFIPVLGAVLLTINFILAPHKPYKEKKTPFECGYHSFLAQNRTQFTVSFFLFGFGFLIFDLEIVSIFPVTVTSYFNGGYGITIVVIFALLLTLGFVFELGNNALNIDTKQENNFILSNIYNFVKTKVTFNLVIISMFLITCYFFF